MNEITIPYPVIKAMVHVIGCLEKKKDPRYYLHSIALTEKGYLVTTDGYKILVYRTDHKPEKTIVWHKEEFQMLVKTGNAKQSVIIDMEQQTAILTNAATPIPLRAFDEDVRYPNVGRYIYNRYEVSEGQELAHRNFIGFTNTMLKSLAAITSAISAGGREATVSFFTYFSNQAFEELYFTFSRYEDRLMLIVASMKEDEANIRTRLNAVIKGDEA